MLNKNKIVKDLIPQLDKAFNSQKLGDILGWNYNILKNISLLKQYQEDPDFKKLLVKAKGKYDEYLVKYGMEKVEK